MLFNQRPLAGREQSFLSALAENLLKLGSHEPFKLIIKTLSTMVLFLIDYVSQILGLKPLIISIFGPLAKAQWQ
jgi:hypothetical protein